MIKPVEEIPKTVTEQRISYREMIRNDIVYAIKNSINKFEFLGDYNFKYLAGYAREEADQITYATLLHECKERDLKNRFGRLLIIRKWRIPKNKWKEYSYIKITSRKEEDRMHVYCEISPDAINKIIDYALEEEKRLGEE